MNGKQFDSDWLHSLITAVIDVIRVSIGMESGFRLATVFEVICGWDDRGLIIAGKWPLRIPDGELSIGWWFTITRWTRLRGQTYKDNSIVKAFRMRFQILWVFNQCVRSSVHAALIGRFVRTVLNWVEWLWVTVWVHSVIRICWSLSTEGQFCIDIPLMADIKHSNLISAVIWNALLI